MKVTPRAIALSLYQSLQQADQSQWDEIVQQHLEYVTRMGKSQWTRHILSEVRTLEQEEKGITPVKVTIGREESKEMVMPLLQKLIPEGEKEIEMSVDPALIGGIRVETENQRWDLSMKKQLQKLSQTIINS